MLMVKPAGYYLDVLADVAARSQVPVAAYHVSGEYAMVCAAAGRGWLNRDAPHWQAVTAILRAGAATSVLTMQPQAGRTVQAGQAMVSFSGLLSVIPGGVSITGPGVRLGGGRSGVHRAGIRPPVRHRRRPRVR